MNALPSHKQVALRQLIAQHQLSGAESTIVENAKECATLSLDKKESYKDCGNSRLGGVPDLPVELPWPKTGDRYLNFIMQVNLESLPSIVNSPLPNKGMLYFFIESDDTCWNVNSRLLFFQGPRSKLKRCEEICNDRLINENYTEIHPFSVKAFESIELPRYGGLLFRQIVDKSKLDQKDDPTDRYFNLMEEAADRTHISRFGSIAGSILGYPSARGGDMRRNAVFHAIGRPGLIHNAQRSLEKIANDIHIAADERIKDHLINCHQDVLWYQENQSWVEVEKEKWILVWQIDSCATADFNIWDAGSFFIFLHMEDLKKGDFSKPYVQIETG